MEWMQEFKPSTAKASNANVSVNVNVNDGMCKILNIGWYNHTQTHTFTTSRTKRERISKQHIISRPNSVQRSCNAVMPYIYWESIQFWTHAQISPSLNDGFFIRFIRSVAMSHTPTPYLWLNLNLFLLVFSFVSPGCFPISTIAGLIISVVCTKSLIKSNIFERALCHL